MGHVLGGGKMAGFPEGTQPELLALPSPQIWVAALLALFASFGQIAWLLVGRAAGASATHR